jgi:hypothetical protein
MQALHGPAAGTRLASSAANGGFVRSSWYSFEILFFHEPDGVRELRAVFFRGSSPSSPP